MKNIVFKLFMLFLGIAAGVTPCRLYAQSDTGKYPVITKGYKFDDNRQTIKKEYIDRILTKKMALLEHYITILIEKKKSNYARYVDSAMLLFDNDDSKLITITNENSGKVYVKQVREYLDDIAKLPYKSVKITYRNYTAINNVHHQPDGSYRGVAVIEQEFTGFDKEGKAMYSDVIRRNIEVDIRIKESYLKDYHLGSVYVHFGNMGVSEATALK